MWAVGGAMMQTISREGFRSWLMGIWLVWRALCGEKYDNMNWPWIDLKQECENYIEAHSAAVQQAAEVAAQRRRVEVEGLGWTWILQLMFVIERGAVEQFYGTGRAWCGSQ